jgi:pyridoxine 5-phosphate synthase
LASIDLVMGAGADGITVHPRRDERHVRLDDLATVSAHMTARYPGVELNVECENHPDLIDRVVALRPAQCTLVPVRPGEVTSDHGWRFPDDHDELVATITRLHAAGVRVSLFLDCDPASVPGAAATGADRVELYTGPFAWAWGTPGAEAARADVFAAAAAAVSAGLGVNAGHDLDRFNLVGLRGLPGLAEVSIGHAQICRALEVGTAASVAELLAALAPS